MDRNTTSYSYAADGRKLRATYKTFPGQHVGDDDRYTERNDSGLVRPGNGCIFVPSTVVETKTVDYVGNLIYEDNVIKKILIDGGYITFNEGNAPEYHFYIKDHLGNNRVVVHTSGEVEQVNHYYPYGGLMAESTNWNTQWYKYNGKARASESRESMYALLCRVQPRLDTVKELDRMHGLDWYDYGARWMDASIGRWHSIDPLCEKYYDVSPYVYCLNNPIKYIDQDGREVKQPKGGENFKLVGILSMIGGSLMMAGATTYSVVTEGSGIVVGGGQLFTAGYATFKAGVATYSTGIAIDAYESISRPNPVNIKDSKQESHSNNKAQSHGSKKRTGDKHAKQYTHGGTKNKPNFTPNQNKRKNADKHRNKGKVVD